MTVQTKQKIVAAAGWVITTLAIFAVSTILIAPEHRSPYFWQRILWAIFLAGLVWAFVGGFVSNALLGRKESRGDGGILPAFGVLAVGYAAASLTLMLLQAWSPENELLNRFHLAGQIVLLAAVGIVCVLLNISRTASAHGTEPIPEGVRSPAALSSLIKAEENRLAQSEPRKDLESLPSLLKTLRERIQYSLPHVGEIGVMSEYRVFAESVEKICHDTSEIVQHPADAGNRLSLLKQEVSNLASKADLIADRLKRR